MYRIVEINDVYGNPKPDVDYRKRNVINVNEIQAGRPFTAMDVGEVPYMITSIVESAIMGYDLMTNCNYIKIKTRNSIYVLKEECESCH